MPPESNALDFLSLYLTDDILEHIVKETNKFTKEFLDANPNKADNRYLKQWTEITTDELKLFLGVIVLMGIIHKPNVNSYWSRDDVFATPIFSQVMP